MLWLIAASSSFCLVLACCLDAACSCSCDCSAACSAAFFAATSSFRRASSAASAACRSLCRHINKPYQCNNWSSLSSLHLPCDVADYGCISVVHGTSSMLIG